MELQGRGGKGVKTYKVTDKTGKLVGAKVVTDKDRNTTYKQPGNSNKA